MLGAIDGLSLVAITIYRLGFVDDLPESVPGPRTVRLTALAAVLVSGGYLSQVAA